MLVSEVTVRHRPDRKRRCLGYCGYRGYFFSNFYKSVFSIFTCSEYRKLGFQKSEIFKHLSKTGDFKNPRFPTSVFSIFTYNEYRKHGCLKISDFKYLSSEYRKLRFHFQKNPRFSNIRVFEYRKHDGCLKISDFKHLSSEYRKLRFQKFRGLQTSVPGFRYSPVVNIENTDV